MFTVSAHAVRLKVAYFGKSRFCHGDACAGIEINEQRESGRLLLLAPCQKVWIVDVTLSVCVYCERRREDQRHSIIIVTMNNNDNNNNNDNSQPISYIAL